MTNLAGSELAYLPLTEVAALIEKRELSPVELTRAQLERIDDLDRRLHSYRTVLAERALAQARQAEAEIAAGRYRGPLHGIPIAVKDLIYSAGIPTACGSPMLQEWLPTADATVMRKLEAAGAILLGKLHMTEYALRWHHPAWPAPVNPWGAELWPGVSSSGSGVATAAGLCYGALGSDTGGSIRFPAACNGVVGLKPTYGRVSRHNVFPLAPSLDTIGPITRRVADAAILLAAIAGHDPHDPTSSHLPVPDYLAMLGQEVKGLRLGVDERLITQGVDPEVSAAVLRSVARLRDLGLEVVEINFPAIDALVETWTTLGAAEAAAAHRATYPSRADEYGPFREWLELGHQQTGIDYAAAHVKRLEVAGAINGLFEEIDLLACPAMPMPPPPMDDKGLPIVTVSQLRAGFTYPFNFSNSPTLTLPCGFTADDLPIALQLVGPHFGEATLVQVGHAYEQATEWRRRVPPPNGS
jgi:amidase